MTQQLETTAEFHPAIAEILTWFDDDHLPEHLRAITGPVKELAYKMARTLTGIPLREGLFQLWHAKNLLVLAKAKELKAAEPA